MKKWIAIFVGGALCLAALNEQVRKHSLAYANTAFTAFVYAVTGGSLTRTEPNRWVDQGVNLAEFCSDPGGTADCAASIQAAIDCSFGTGTGCSGFNSGLVKCPAGALYKSSLPLFLDRPGNLRGNAAAWAVGTTYAINNVVTYLGIPWKSLSNGNVGNTPSMTSAFWQSTVATANEYSDHPALVGQESIQFSGNIANCIIRFTFNNAPALILSPGQGPLVKNVSIEGTGSGNAALQYRCGQPSLGIGIAITGGSGGATGTTVENSAVDSFYIGIETGFASGSVGSENRFYKSKVTNSCMGTFYSGTQNFADELYSMDVCGTYPVLSQSTVDIRIFGGSYGPCGESGQSAAFAISSTSTLTATARGNNFDYTFTTTWASPDIYLTQTCVKLAETPAANGIYNAFTINTAHFGVIPLLLQSCSGNVGSFQILPNWSNFYLATTNTAITVTDLQAEIQAAAKVYATEMVTTFTCGMCSIKGSHVETTTAFVQLIWSQAASGASAASALKDVFENYDPAFPQYGPAHSPTDAQLAVFYAAQSFPHIRVSRSLEVDTVDFSSSADDRFVIDFDANGQLFVNNWTDVKGPNIRVNGLTQTFSGANGDGGFYQCSIGRGCGVFDKDYFASQIPGLGGSQTISGEQASPMWGWRPAPYATPRIAPSQLTTLMGALPTISPTVLGYPLPNGDTFYNSAAWNSGALTHAFARSAHSFYSYGQNLTTTNVPSLNWTAKGQSFVVQMCATLGACTANETAAIKMMRAGLGVQLNTTSNLLYEVTGVYPQLGYITVVNAQQDGSPYGITGVKTTVYTGTTIGQQSYSWTQYPFLLKRDLDPAANDNSPMWLSEAA